jgi:hypothetical protein
MRFVERHGLHAPAMDRLARIVRGADTGALALELRRAASTPFRSALRACSTTMPRSCAPACCYTTRCTRGASAQRATRTGGAPHRCRGRLERGRGELAAADATRAEALRYWLRLGCISFGGPAGQIAIMHRELVDERRWISERRFLHALNYCMVLPGPRRSSSPPTSAGSCTARGAAIVAGGLFVLPSLVVLIALSWLYVTFGDVPLVAAALYGVKPRSLPSCCTRHGASARARCASGAVGDRGRRVRRHLRVRRALPCDRAGRGSARALGARLLPAAFTRTAHRDAHGTRSAPSVIDDDTPTPAHARFTPRRLAAVLAVGALLWADGHGALIALEHGGGTLTQMAGSSPRRRC